MVWGLGLRVFGLGFRESFASELSTEIPSGPKYPPSILELQLQKPGSHDTWG